MKSVLEEKGAVWIWPAAIGKQDNQYVEFQREFQVNETSSPAKLLISVDSNYAVKMNDVFVNCGQFSNYPNEKTYDTLDVGPYLRKGKNTLTIGVYYQGVACSCYFPGAPGLIFLLETGGTTVVSGPGILYRRIPGYQYGPMPTITWQLGLTFGFDARKNEDWKTLNADEILPAPGERTLSPRPLKKLDVKPRILSKIYTQGVFKREPEGEKSPGLVMQTDFLSARRSRDIFTDINRMTLPSQDGIAIKTENFASGGVYIVLDMGREEAGLLEIELDTNAGAIVDVGWGEHLDDLRVRTHVDQRNFGIRYVCKDGRQTFTNYYLRVAGRYLQLHVTGVTEKFILHYAGLRPTEYPVRQRGTYQSPDRLMNQTYLTSIRTLQLCMHEHYEDCPWREQALYANDGRNQALAGYYAFGEYAFPAISFELLAKGMKDDGYMEICAPAVVGLTIPSFSMVWFLAVGDYWRFSGDLDYVKKMMPYVKKMMDTHLSQLQDSFMGCKDGKYYWHFYDWVDGMASWPVDDGSNRGRIDAPLNLFFCMALDESAKMASLCGQSDDAKKYQAAADAIRSRFHDMFWNDQEKAYATYRRTQGKDHFAELTQSLAILSGAAPAPIAAALKERLIQDNSGLVQTTISQSLYVFEALLTEKEKYGQWVYDKITRDWGHMLFNGATSFWETLKAGWDFDNAGSLCHGWSAIPVYLLASYVLGIRPLEPGFRRFSVDPIRNILPCASGEVPTPFGTIKIKWEKQGSKTVYELSHPDTISPDISHLSSTDEIRIIK